MTKNYTAHILKSNTKLKLTFRNRKFLKFELLSGKLHIDQIKYIGLMIPPTEDNLQTYQKEFANRVQYDLIEKTKTIYQLFTDAWFTFYNNQMGFLPKFGKADGNHLKQIINYLTKINGTEKAALEFFQTILSNWKSLDEFHQKNIDLKYINSNINKILSNVKRNSNEAAGVDSEYVESIINDLQS